MRNIGRIAILVLLFTPAPLRGADKLAAGVRFDLGGAWKWQSAELAPGNGYETAVSDKNWASMQIPSNWFLQGHDLAGQVWFRRTFRMKPQFQGEYIQLVFEGVDYAADVWLNGRYLGYHEGYFQPFWFDVSGLVSFTGDNLLAIRVNSPNEQYGSVWSLHKRLIKGVFNHHDTRPGGAWSESGQNENTGGIWAAVYLRVSNLVGISALQVGVQPVSLQTESEDGHDWQVSVTIVVENTGDANRSVDVETRVEPANFVAGDVSGGMNRRAFNLHPGSNVLAISLRSQNTRLWWSWDQGSQHLYRVLVRLSSESSVLDEEQDEVGFRTIRVAPKLLEWRLNGRRIFLRGTNYISSQWLSEMTPERYDFDAALMKRANINAIRVHAHIEAQSFYRACDKAGLLVWQDFPLQWGYTEEQSFEGEAVRQARDMVAMLINRPSIIAWSMHNEPPWDAPWMQYRYKDYDSSQNKRLDQALFQVVHTADPSRYVHPASETAEHPWLGWYSGNWQDYGKPTQQPLITEYGAQALPVLSSLRKIFGEDDLWPDSDAKWEKWEYHNFQRHETFELARVAKGSNLEEFIRNTQEYQSRLIGFAAESYRRQRFQPVAAIFEFMFVEDWPSVNWGVVDYWRVPKPGYDALATAYQPVLPSVVWDREVWPAGADLSLDLWAINDLPMGYPQSHFICTLRRRGDPLQKMQLSFNLAADSGRKVGQLVQKGLQPGSYELQVWIEDAHGTVLGRNSFSFRAEASKNEAPGSVE